MSTPPSASTSRRQRAAVLLRRRGVEICPSCAQPIPAGRANWLRARRRRCEEARGARQRAAPAADGGRREATAPGATEHERTRSAPVAGRPVAPADDAVTRALRRQADDMQPAALRARLADAERRNARLHAEGETLRAQLAVRRIGAARDLAALRAAEERLAAAERAKADADRLSAEAAAARQIDKQRHEAELAAQRDALEQATRDAVNAEKAAAFRDRMTLCKAVDDLRRKLERQTARGREEGAEIKLLEALKAAFKDDRIAPVGDGTVGADIIHTVIHRGAACGTLVYDSKDRHQWRNEFVDRLKADQLAARASCAILATRVPPAGAAQLALRDGVIVANPARIPALVAIVRRHIIRLHGLAHSHDARDRKTAELYSFITSERCADLFDRVAALTAALEDLRTKEIDAHRLHWKREGELCRSLEKANADLRDQIDQIVGGECGDG